MVYKISCIIVDDEPTAREIIATHLTRINHVKVIGSCENAGATIPEEMQGQSMRSLLSQKSKGEDFRDAIYYHYYDFPAFHMVKKHYGVRTQRYKLMHFYDDIDEWELYDLEKDKQELTNIYNDPDYAEIRKELHQTLKSLQKNYQVSSTEFEKTPKERIDRAYRNFEKLAGKQ